MFSLLVSWRRVKKELAEGEEGAGWSLHHPEELEGEVRNRTAAEIVEVLWQLYKRCEKCMKSAGAQTKKN